MDIKSNVALTSKPMSIDINRTPTKNMNSREMKGSKSDTESIGLLPIIENGVNENEILSWHDLVEQEEAEQLLLAQQMAQQMAHTQYESQPQLNIPLTYDQYSQTSGLIDEYLTLQQWRDKYENIQSNGVVDAVGAAVNLVAESAVTHTTKRLNDMENEFLMANQNRPSILISTQVAMSSDNAMITTPIKPPQSSHADELSTKNATNSTKVDEKIGRPDEKKIQTIERQKSANVIFRNVTMTNRNNLLPKPTMNRVPLVTKKLSPTSVVAPKTSIIAPIRTRIVVQNPVSNRRPMTTMRPSGVPSNTATRLAARSKTMMDLNKNPMNHANSLKARDCDNTLNKMNDRRSEPKTVSTRIEDDDGWLTVKTRRRSSLHWANRFNQPSGYASLPTLALLNEKEANSTTDNKPANNKRDNKKVAKVAPQKLQSNETLKSSTDSVTKSDLKNGTKKPTDVGGDAKRITGDVKQTTPANNKTKASKSTENHKSSSAIVSRATILQRQKSDITGLKINSLRKEYMRIEKSRSKQKETKKAAPTDDQPSDRETKTNNVELSTDSVKLDSNGLQSSKDDISINGCASTEDLVATNGIESPNDNSNNTSIDHIDHNDIMLKVDHETDDNVELESDQNQRKLHEEQMCLERQILELQNTEIEIDTDDADCDTILGIEENDSNATELDESCDGCLDAFEEHDLEVKYQHLLSDLSSGERIQTLATLQAFVSRHPGRAQELHQKLSSPSRRRSLHESLKKYQVKQDRAQDMRETLTKEKTLKLQVLLARVEDVKAAKQKLIEEKRLRMEEKLQRYAENRTQYLKDKIRKAHDEEEKLKEIAFIKELEAQNKRLDLMEMHKEQEGRLQDLEQERQKKVEEKAAKEAAVERRRLELAKERQKRLEIIDETRKKREQRVEQKQEERDKLRQKLAREKVNSLCRINRSPFFFLVILSYDIDIW